MSREDRDLLSGIRRHPAPFIVLGIFGYGLGMRFFGDPGAIIGVMLGLIIAFWLTYSAQAAES